MSKILKKSGKFISRIAGANPKNRETSEKITRETRDIILPTYYVYAILCQGGTIYIGQTDNLEDRWHRHCEGTGAEWTKNHKPIKIVHVEEFNSREEAVKREHDLKTGFGRKWLKRMLDK